MESSLRHIVVIQLGSLSNAAICVHALRGLVRDFPEVRVTVVTHTAHLPLFRNLSGLEFVCADQTKYRGLVGQLRLRRDIHRLRPGAIADLTATPLSRLLSSTLTPWRCKVARLRNPRLEGKELTRKYRKVMVQHQSLSSRSRDLFGSLGLPFCMPAPVRRTRAAELPAAVEILAGEKKGQWVGVALLTPHHGTCYPIPLSAKLVDLLAERYDKLFLFGRGEYQRQFCEGMQMLHPNAISVAERLSLSEEMDMLSMLDAVVTVDCDILSLASLVGTPAISIWGATHPFLESSGYGQDPKNSIQCTLPCRPCSTSGRRKCLFSNYECMHSITPEMVFSRVKSVTGRRTPSTPFVNKENY